MRTLACITLAVALSACAFDGSGSRSGDDQGPAADAAGDLDIDAAPPVDAAPAPVDSAPPPTDGLVACDFDQQCETGEDPATCFDCFGGGGFVCNFDQTCDSGEDPNCPECSGGGGFVCDFDGQCESGEDMNCLDCIGFP